MDLLQDSRGDWSSLICSRTNRWQDHAQACGFHQTRRHGIDITRDTPAKDPHPLAIPPPDLSRMTEIPPSAPPIALSSQSSTLASQRTRIPASHPPRQSTRKCQRPDHFSSK